VSDEQRPEERNLFAHAESRSPQHRRAPHGFRKDIVLEGCRPTPLASYLKALGVLRLLSEQKPELQCQGYWLNEFFVLSSPAFTGHEDHSIISKFFLEQYRPSPLVTPWNGRGGFLEGDEEEGKESSRAGAQMVRVFSSNMVDRFRPLARALAEIAKIGVFKQLNSERAKRKRLKANAKPKGRTALSKEEKPTIRDKDTVVNGLKAKLLQELRNRLPDDMLQWFDACFALLADMSSGGKKPAHSPLLGVGGLDGSMDFGVNYLKRLNDVFDPQTGKPRDDAQAWLRNAIFGDKTNKLYSVSRQDGKKVAVGQFSPVDAGGYNAGNGFDGSPLLNPWNTILQLEGAVLFAASTGRRLAGSGDNVLASLPFTVALVPVGQAVMPSDEERAKRTPAEMWLPLWKKPATCRELQAILREGRVTLRRRAVVNGFDFVRAVTSLGTSRGIEQFQRYAFLKRCGDAFFAVDQGRFDVRRSAYGTLVDELEGNRRFLSSLRSLVHPSNDRKAGVRLRVLVNRLEACLVRALRTDERNELTRALELLGEIQFGLAVKVRVSKNAADTRGIPIVPMLSERWVQAADDGTAAYRIAKALAGLNGVGRDATMPLRAQLFPIQRKCSGWTTPDSNEEARIYTGWKGRLVETLTILLRRRLWLAAKLEMRDKPLDSPAGATLEDVNAFLADDTMDERIAALLPGLSLCRIPPDADHKEGAPGRIPAAFALMKLTLTPDRTLRSLGLLGDDVRLRVPSDMLAQLAAGNHGNRALRIAWRRLRTSGLAPVVSLSTLPGEESISPPRTGAALLIPLRYGATATLARNVLSLKRNSDVVTQHPGVNS